MGTRSALVDLSGRTFANCHIKKREPARVSRFSFLNRLFLFNTKDTAEDKTDNAYDQRSKEGVPELIIRDGKP